MAGTWNNCTSLTSFPQIDTSSVTTLASTWGSCTNLTSFPSINTENATDIRSVWENCSSLETVPGPLDFRNAVNSSLRLATFKGSAITHPAPTGTPVRDRDDALDGFWGG
jgi:hypothetical protein